MKESQSPLYATPPGSEGASRLLALVDRSAPPHRPVGGLIHRWYTASGTDLIFDEWADPATHDLADAFDGPAPFDRVEQALVAFAQARAGADHGIDRLTADIRALIRVAWPTGLERWGEGIDPVAVLARAFGAWAVEHAATSLGSCADEVTGLVGAGYLKERVRELHDQCDALAISPPVTFGAVVVQLELGAVPVTARMEVRVAAGRILASRFRAGETVAALGPSRMVAVMPAYGIDRAATGVRADLRAHPALDGIDLRIGRQAFATDAASTYRSLAGTSKGS